MAVGIKDFWKLAVRSGVVTAEQAHLLQRQFAQRQGTSPDKENGAGDTKALAQWLIESNVLTRYQARVLLKGLAGPFRFGDYRIADRIGEGRFRQTYRAVHTPTGHPVALRFYDTNVVPDEARWPAVTDAVRQLSRLRSPRLHRCYAWCEQGSFRYAVMEDFVGEPLDRRLQSQGPLEWEAACRVVRQVAEGLAELQGLGRAHGDIRPENIWWTDHGCVRLVVEPTEWTSPLSLIVHTPLDEVRLDYLAPELAVAGHAPDHLTDLYALGCTFYELLGGGAPFADAATGEKIERHGKETPKSLVESGVPTGVYAIVESLIAKNPSERLQSAEALIERINGLVPTSDPLPLPTPSQAAFEKSLAPASEEPPAEAPPAVPSPPAAIQPEPSAEEEVVPLSPEAAEPEVDIPAPVVTPDTPRGHRSRYRRRRRRSQTWIVWLVGAIVLAVSAYVLYPILTKQGSASRKKTEQQEKKESTSSGDRKEQGEAESDGANKSSVPTDEGEGPALVEDDGKTLWADPVQGEPISLAYLPPGIQCILHGRPAELEKQEAATKFQAALGPRWQYYRQAWEELTHIPWSDIDQIVVGFRATDMHAFPQPAIVAYLANTPGAQGLVERWGNPPPQMVQGKKVYALGAWQAYLPEEHQGKVVVLGTPEHLADVIEQEGASPVVLRQLTRLLASSNNRHHVTLLAVPAFLENDLLQDDFTFYFGKPVRVRDFLTSLLIDEVTAFRVSVALADPVYVELRLHIGSAPDAASLLAEQRRRLGQLADWAEESLSRHAVPDYWRRVALRFPQMLRFVDQYLRGSAEGRELVFNAVLPSTGPANLLVGAEMMLLAGQTASTTASKEPAKQTPKTMEALLQSKMSMMFDQTSLDFAVKDLEAIVKDQYPDLAFPFAIKILGGDLQLNGITQNQQIVNFRHENETLSDILTAIVMKANPITTVKKPSEMDQKLIWVVGPDPENKDRNIILITTRDAAKERNYKLPQPFMAE